MIGVYLLTPTKLYHNSQICSVTEFKSNFFRWNFYPEMVITPCTHVSSFTLQICIIIIANHFYQKTSCSTKHIFKNKILLIACEQIEVQNLTEIPWLCLHSYSSTSFSSSGSPEGKLHYHDIIQHSHYNLCSSISIPGNEGENEISIVGDLWCLNDFQWTLSLLPVTRTWLYVYTSKERESGKYCL